jgi:antitoxin StbD
MQIMFTDRTVSISDFKKNPASVLRAANHHPVAVMSHNKPAFYMVEPKLFEAMLEEISDHELRQTVLARLAEKAHAIEVDIDQI